MRRWWVAAGKEVDSCCASAAAQQAKQHGEPAVAAFAAIKHHTGLCATVFCPHHLRGIVRVSCVLLAGS